MGRFTTQAIKILHEQGRPMNIHEIHSEMRMRWRNTPNTRSLAKALMKNSEVTRIGIDTPSVWAVRQPLNR